MDNKLLEQFYERIILPRYEGTVSFGDVAWADYGKVGLDAWAHHFQAGGKEYDLVYEDFPAIPTSMTVYLPLTNIHAKQSSSKILGYLTPTFAYLKVIRCARYRVIWSLLKNPFL